MLDGDDELLAIAISIVRGTSDQLAHDVLRQHPFHFILPSRPCRVLVYSTKGEWLLKLNEWSLPPDVALVWRYGPLGPSEVTFVQRVQEHLAAPVRFVGDLDPLDLATYATLVSTVSACTYVGIGDTWHAACELDRAQQGRPSLHELCIKMEPAEQDGLASLTAAGFEWSDVVGERGRALLASGAKLELEGASNPQVYSAAFSAQLKALLLS